tara:strand:+ start:1287 stop:1628 length:342 start_codon:yes stop_codon:yes gene_type:complete
MAQKKLQKGSQYAKYDLDGDGVVSDEELAMDEKMLRLEDLKSDIENEDKKQDSQRQMAWMALVGMIFYPIVTLVADALGLKADILASMADLYFIASAGIVAAFYGKEAYLKRK